MVRGVKEAVVATVDRLDMVPEKVDERAFELMTSFKEALCNDEDFQEAAARHHFGIETDDGHRVLPRAKGEIHFWRGNVLWGISYNSTDNDQELLVSREDHLVEAVIIADSISLRSRRLFGQRPISQPEIIKSHLLYDENRKTTSSVPGVNKNSSAAILEAEELLDNFRSTA